MKLRSLLQKIALKKGRHFSSSEDLERCLEEFATQDLMQKDTLQQAFEITDQEMELLYRDSYVYYQKKHYAEAAISFRYLVLFNPFIKKYWMGLGACQQMRGEADKALHSYGVAALLDSTDPYPHFYAYQCYLAEGNTVESAKALSLAYEKCLDNSLYQSLLSKIISLMNQKSS